MGRAYEIKTPEGLAKYPSVTTIIGQLDKPALVQWSANMAIEYIKDHFESIQNGEISFEEIDFERAKTYHKEVSGEACDIGGVVHYAIECYIKDTIGQVPKQRAVARALDEIKSLQNEEDKEKTPAYEQAVSAFSGFIDWITENHVEFISSEVVVYSHKYKYAGTLDIICRINGKLYVLDIKTSKDHWIEHSYQTISYKKAHEEMSGKRIYGNGTLRLDKITGEFSFKDWTHKRKEHWVVFKNLVSIFYNARNRQSGKLEIIKVKEDV